MMKYCAFVFNPSALERYSDPAVRASIIEANNFQERKAAFRQVQDFVKTLFDAGIKVPLGTDSGPQAFPWVGEPIMN
ncbi:MAG: hypothetical protein CM1200mP40_01120 [Gammaproteobacteria bacterium]|nr:MAG: hypothetical protein CM1200mP40_01120 [Gammaproteobacteria bacterium]